MGIGKHCKGFIKQVREDGKLDVGLTKVGYAKVDALAERILQSLKQNQGFLPLHDKSTPEQIAKILKMSKANFKKSIGQLYRKKLIMIENNGIRINE
jgi:predicted RNA-binding protein (virulence factor B family)